MLDYLLTLMLALQLCMCTQDVHATGKCTEDNALCTAGAAGIYVSFVMVGRVDTLRGDYVGRLRNSVQFIQTLCEVHNVRSEVCVCVCVSRAPV